MAGQSSDLRAKGHHWSFSKTKDGQLLSGPAIGYIVETEPGVRIYHLADTAILPRPCVRFVMFEVVLTKLTHEVESAVVLEWLKAEGDIVEKGEPLVRVETDKATMEMEADAAGRLAGISVNAGEDVPVGTRLAYLLDEGESVPAEVGALHRTESTSAPPPPTPRAPTSTSEAPRPEPTSRDDSPSAGGRIVATPIARRLAREQGVDLAGVDGTGPEGRIIEADVARHDARAGAPLTGYSKLDLSSVQHFLAGRSRTGHFHGKQPRHVRDRSFPRPDQSAAGRHTGSRPNHRALVHLQR